MKRRILGLFASFLVVMLLFTVLSRAADGMSIARVTTARPQQSKIAHKVTGSGKVSQNREQAVSTLPGQVVKTIYVEEGQKVAAGDLLFEIDLEELNEQILEQKQEMKKEELLSMDKASGRAADAQKAALERSRAAQDYNAAAGRANAAVNRAWQEWKAAEDKLNALSIEDIQAEQANQSSGESQDFAAEGSPEDAFTDMDMEEFGGEAGSLEEPEEDVVLIPDSALAGGDDIFGAEPDAAALAAQREYEEKKAQLQEDVTAKRRAYEDAVASSEESVRTAGRSVEDANLPEASDSTEEIDAITREQAQLKLNKLERLLDAAGRITAPIEGTVTKVNILTGEKTPDGTALLLSDTASGSKLVVQVQKEQEKYVARGDAATVNQEGKEKKWKELTVDSVRVNEEDPDLLDVTVQLPKDSLESGMAAVLEVSRSSELFNCCIPIQALYEENGKNFVYVLEESESILGKEMTVRRVDVTVLDKNEMLAALQDGTISSEQKVIESSDKALAHGSRVRLAEE